MATEEEIDTDEEGRTERRRSWVSNSLPEIVCSLLLVAWIVAVKWRRPGDDSFLWVAFVQAIAWNNLLTIPHEMGHALMARALGGRVLMVRLGSGPRLGVFRALKIPWHVHLGIGGLSYSDDAFLQRNRYRLRSWLAIAAGPGTNLLLAACGIVLGGLWNLEDFLPKEGYAVLQSFVVVNLVGAMIALWPRTMYEDGEDFPTDGLQLLRIPRMTDEEVEAEIEWARNAQKDQDA